ncbi:hypothetical protein [Rahnella sp. ChDrAdgB13]|uniref:hypothetical protein n=1 Tax=Rahnella sp. ChDrAdgB13 TaxID=1850581 RepID=UPI001AD87B41|nr:hypothetical protein [Rahnella sp. ChDrAdgB13]
MPGKLIEINPEVSLRSDQISEVRLSHDWLSLCVTTTNGEELDAVPLEGETLEMARRRLFAAVNAQESDVAQLIRLGPTLYINPAEVTTVGKTGSDVRIGIRGADYVSFYHEDPVAMAEEIAAQVNAAMRERQRSLNTN